MKILVTADIHGCLSTARRIADLAHKHQPEHIIMLGDILYHGPRNPLPTNYDPMGTAKVLAPLAAKIIAVAGNCDAEVDAAILPFPLAPGFSWIIADGLRIFATHGHHYTPDNLPLLRKGDVFLHGHTHIPTVRNHRGIYICNPGSLTLPKDDHPASYGLFENGTFYVYTEDHDTYLCLDCF